ncbi:Methyltransferase-Like Protein 7B [Manis pentadactyla]|nr:Methyltransferase-Like Protein 7B [Manis pentadactyla]
MSPPRLEGMRPELGDRGQVDKVVALRTVKAVGGRTLRGTTGRLSRAAPRVGIRAPPRREALEPAGGGPTDGQAQCLHRLNSRWNGVSGAEFSGIKYVRKPPDSLRMDVARRSDTLDLVYAWTAPYNSESSHVDNMQMNLSFLGTKPKDQLVHPIPLGPQQMIIL